MKKILDGYCNLILELRTINLSRINALAENAASDIQKQIKANNETKGSSASSTEKPSNSSSSSSSKSKGQTAKNHDQGGQEELSLQNQFESDEEDGNFSDTFLDNGNNNMYQKQFESNSTDPVGSNLGHSEMIDLLSQVNYFN